MKIGFEKDTKEVTGPRYSRGLSLIELLVVITIMTIISAAVLARHGGFNSTTLLSNLAYDIALSVRQAQAYGISVRDAGGGNFQRPYGVHFQRGSGGVATSYIIFQDLGLTPNGLYDGGSEFIEQYNLRRGHRIIEACASSSCFSGSLSVLNIVFKRPNPDAIINANPNARACVVVEDEDGEGRRTITVLATGQISISNPGVCP